LNERKEQTGSMNYLTVLVSAKLIEEGLRTGYESRRCIISKGLPPDAKLIDAKMIDERILQLKFETENTNCNSTVTIEITTVDNAREE